MDTSLPTAFDLAVRSVEGNTPLTPLRQQLNTQHALALYALYQQAMHGDYDEGEVINLERRPGVGIFSVKALGAAWALRRGMTREKAMMAYIDIVIRIGRRSRFRCSAEESPVVQQTLLQLTQALEHARTTDQSDASPSTPTESTTAQSPSWSSETSVTQIETDSSDGEESFQSSRESVDGSDVEDGEKDAVVAMGTVPLYVRRSRGVDGKLFPRPMSQRREQTHHRQPSNPIPLYLNPIPPSIPQTSQLTPPPEIQNQSPTSPTPPPYAHDLPVPPSLASSIEAIQISLTALHERLSALEHAQRISNAAQGENPWVALARGMGLFRSGKASEERGKGWVVRLVMRLMSTARRAVVDVSFVLGIICAVVAIRAALRRRLRGTLSDLGGRHAVVDFCKGVVGVVGKVGEGWKR